MKWIVVFHGASADIGGKDSFRSGTTYSPAEGGGAGGGPGGASGAVAGAAFPSVS